MPASAYLIKRRQAYRGFHLIEILIVLAIIGIMAQFAWPQYQHYLTNTRRLEAAQILLKLASALEKYHFENNTYQNITLAELNFPDTIVKNNYQLSIQAAYTNDYLLVAKPLGNQAVKDKQCASLFLHANGEKEISGNGNVDTCW